MSDDYLGNGPESWKEINPDADELFDSDGETIDEWPSNVWMGVVDPHTGERIPPTKCTQFELKYD